MNAFKRFLVLAVLSLIMATGLFFINRTVIVKSSFLDKIAEIVFLAIPVFIVLALMYYVNRSLVRSIKKARNKKPSAGEGLKS